MKISKKSLLAKVIIYNDIAILLSSLIVFLAMSSIIFKDIENRTPKLLKNASQNIDISYKTYISNVEMQLDKILKDKHYNLYLEKIDDLIIFKNKYSEISSVQQEILFNTRKLNNEFLNYFNQKLEENEFYNSLYFSTTLVDSNNNIIAENLGSDNKNEYSLNSRLHHFRINVQHNEERIFNYFDLIDGSNELLLRMVIRVEDEFSNFNYLVISTLINENFLEMIRNYIDLDKNIKLFLIYEDIYIAGQLGFESGKVLFKSKNKEDVLIHEKIEGNEKYKLAYTPIINTNGRAFVNIGLAISDYMLIEANILPYISTIIIIMILILISSFLFGNIFSNLFMPLLQLTNISNEVSNGNLDVKWKIRAEGEIKILANAMKKMVKTIKLNQEDLTEQNDTLKLYINRLSMVENLLASIHDEDDVNAIIMQILESITNDNGFAFARAIYLEYDIDFDSFKGRLSSVNLKILEEDKESYPLSSRLKLQTESIEKIVKLITIDLGENIISESFDKNKIIYYNDRGFKYNLGSELLTSIGLNNFAVLPLYTKSKKYGVIVVDHCTRKKKITDVDLEMFRLLVLHMSIYLKNKELEINKLKAEQNSLVSYLSNRILREIKMPVSNIEDILSDYNKNKEIDKDKILGIDKNIKKITRLSSMILEYSDVQEYEFNKIDLKEVIDKSVENCKGLLENSVIDLSKLYTHKEYIIGNKDKLEKVFTNILANAIDAVDKIGGRINITTKSLDNAISFKILDNGTGIESRYIHQIFEPFFSLKNASGLGLSVAKKIIKEHGGSIKIKSIINRGTEVKITLNIYKEE